MQLRIAVLKSVCLSPFQLAPTYLAKQHSNHYRWMSAGMRPSLWLVSARSVEHSSPSVPVGTGGLKSQSQYEKFCDCYRWWMVYFSCLCVIMAFCWCVAGYPCRNEANSSSSSQICTTKRKMVVNLYTNCGAASLTDAFWAKVQKCWNKGICYHCIRMFLVTCCFLVIIII